MLTNAGAQVTLHWSEGGHQIETVDIEKGRIWLRENFS
jgi:predicted esterase